MAQQQQQQRYRAIHLQQQPNNFGGVPQQQFQGQMQQGGPQYRQGMNPGMQGMQQRMQGMQEQQRYRAIHLQQQPNNFGGVPQQQFQGQMQQGGPQYRQG